MTQINVSKKSLLAVVAVALVGALFVVGQAFAMYYVHSDAQVAKEGMGAMEVLATLDESATGGAVRTELVFIHEGASADDVLDEMLISSESQQGVEAIHNYDTQSVRDYLQSKAYTVEVHDAASQKPGTQTTYDTSSKGDAKTTLNRYDNVVIRVS